MIILAACLVAGIVIGVLPLPWWVQWISYVVVAVVAVAVADTWRQGIEPKK